MLDYIIQLVDISIWPAVVITAICLFKKQIRELLNRIYFVDLGKRVIGFHDALTDPVAEQERKIKRIEKEVSASKAKDIKQDKPATLFWFSNDLMWIQDMLFRNAPKEAILDGIQNLLKYSRKLGLEGTFAGIELKNLIQAIEPGPDNPPFPWSIESKVFLTNQIEKIKWSVASRLEEYERGFKKLRVFPGRYSKNN